jgi:TatD DNase family protein
MQIVDSHAHLHFDSFDQDRGEVLRRAREAGVVAMIDVGTDAATSARAFELASAEAGIFPTAGIHPNDSGAATAADWERVEALIEDPRCVAVGECGLDWYRDRTPKEVQKPAFERQVRLARERDLPIIIHCREAFADVYALLRGVGSSHRGVMHCFSGDAAQAREAVALGLHVSFAGPLTYKKNVALRDALAQVPADKVLVETDCPFLPPEGKRGQRNEPAFLPFLVHEIARASGESPERAARRTSANAQALFRLPIRLDAG